jgi:hypothetical protein
LKFGGTVTLTWLALRSRSYQLQFHDQFASTQLDRFRHPDHRD